MVFCCSPAVVSLSERLALFPFRHWVCLVRSSHRSVSSAAKQYYIFYYHFIFVFFLQLFNNTSFYVYPSFHRFSRFYFIIVNCDKNPFITNGFYSLIESDHSHSQSCSFGIVLNTSASAFSFHFLLRISMFKAFI